MRAGFEHRPGILQVRKLQQCSLRRPHRAGPARRMAWCRPIVPWKSSLCILAGLFLREDGCTGPGHGVQSGSAPCSEGLLDRSQRGEREGEKIMKMGKISRRPMSMTSDSRIIAQSE